MTNKKIHVETVLTCVKETVQKYNMLQKDDRVVAGVSGGPDSVALIRILKSLQKEFFFDLGIVHVNHKLREKTSDRDETFVRLLAKELDLPYHVKSEDVEKYCKNNGLSIEHGARKIRYAFFDHVLKTFGYTKIALGHHADDNAEVVLMALLRGSGPLGLAGIPPVRDQRIIRPLFHLTKSEIYNFLDHHQWPFIVDETNLKPDYLRNRIRLDLIPLLQKEYNPNIVETLNRISNIVMLENDALEKCTDKLILSDVSKEATRAGEKGYSFGVSSVCHIHAAQQRRLIRGIIKKVKGDLKRIDFGHVEAVLSLIKNGPPTGEIHLPDQILVSKKNDRIVILRKTRPLRHFKSKHNHGQNKEYGYVIDQCKKVVVKEINAAITFSVFTKEKIREKIIDIGSAGQEIAFFDIKKVYFPMILRNFNDRDRFVPLGMTGSQAVKKFLKDHKIRADQRCRVPVLVINGQVAWVVGHRIDDRFKVTEKTQKILKAEIQRPESIGSSEEVVY